MTPDEVVKVLKTMKSFKERLLVCGGNSPDNSIENEISSLSSAISLIQDYQKLREKVSVEKIGEVLGKIEIPIDTNPMEVKETSIPAVIMLKSVYGRIISQAIVTFLGCGENLP
jgi:hypothetical protein